MGIPHHRNIGDNAIAVAEEKLLHTYFKDYEMYELPESKLEVCAQKIKNLVQEDDILLLHGGGNIGDTYEKPEKGRRMVIQTFSNNKIIVFPQTAFFSDTPKGQKELEISKRIYNEHKNLVLLAREKKSYEFMKQHFYNAKVFLTPDIVMTMKKTSQEEKIRNGALLLFRTDQEKTIENEKVEEIKNLMQHEFGQYTLSDMSYGNKRLVNVGGKFRDQILEEKFEQFQSAQLVVTDRLHGMIFAAITETPCIAFSNFNYKVIGCYEWLKNLGYIKYCNDFSQVEKYVKELKEMKHIHYDNQFAVDQIVSILKKEIEE